MYGYPGHHVDVVNLELRHTRKIGYVDGNHFTPYICRKCAIKSPRMMLTWAGSVPFKETKSFWVDRDILTMCASSYSMVIMTIFHASHREEELFKGSYPSIPLSYTFMETRLQHPDTDVTAYIGRDKPLLG